MFAKSHRRKQNATLLSACRLFFGIALRLACHAEAQVSQRPARPLRVGYLSTSATMALLWTAKEIGGFAKQGLNVEVLSVISGLGVPALIANELDAVRCLLRLTASLRGHDVVFVAGLLNTMIWDFYAEPKLTSTEQLT